MAKLYIVATPIGNLEDITLRALRVLREEVACIFCEDTRVSAKLLNHYQITGKELLSCNQENEEKRITLLMSRLDAGLNVAFLSDAGTPLLSDPGFLMVKALRMRNTESANSRLQVHELIPLPGASALTAALSVTDIDTARFVFEGFLPHGPKQRRRVLKKLIEEERPIIFFESPHRLLKTLKDIKDILGDRKIFLARELTKKFEQFYSGSISEAQEILDCQFPGGDLLGEFVLIIGPLC
jgi:16S rRNA (cytidine1402-2'-O)-methyltransferase